MVAVAVLRGFRSRHSPKMITTKNSFWVSYSMFLGDASSGLAIFMGPQELMKQCLGAVFVGCLERFDHIGGLAIQLGDVFWRMLRMICSFVMSRSQPRGPEEESE